VTSYDDTIKAAQWLMAKPYVDKGPHGRGAAAMAAISQRSCSDVSIRSKRWSQRGGVQQLHADRVGLWRGETRFYYYWEKPEEFARISPHTMAANFKTPRLIIHNQMDMRVPVNHGIELSTRSRAKACRANWCTFQTRTTGC